MYRFFFLAFLFSCFTSCYHENKEIIKVPENKLSEEQMVDILTDLQLAEGIITYRRIEKLTANDYGQAVYTKVIDEHQLSREQLQENIDFYNDSPKLMEKIYDEVLTRLNKMQAEIMLVATQQDSLSKILTDSIQKLDSSQRFDHINLVLLALKDTTHSKNDSIPNWNYLEKITIPGFIY